MYGLIIDQLNKKSKKLPVLSHIKFSPISSFLDVSLATL